MPIAVGVPLMVITSPDQLALTPAGNPFAAATPSSLMPVAPVVAIVISVKAKLLHSVGLVDAVPAVLVVTVFSMASVYTAEDGEQVYAPLLYQVV